MGLVRTKAVGIFHQRMGFHGADFPRDDGMEAHQLQQILQQTVDRPLPRAVTKGYFSIICV